MSNQAMYRGGVRRRGMAFIMAIAALPIAVLAIESIAALVAADIKQTQELAARAQVEQLLLAGCLTASHGQTVTLPPTLVSSDAHVNVDGHSVTASVRNFSQTIPFESTPSNP